MPENNWGYAVCDACNKDFRMGPRTEEILRRDPFDTILCKRCTKLRERDEAEEREYGVEYY